MSYYDLMAGLGFMIGGILLTIARNKVVKRRNVRRTYKSKK